MELPNCLDCKHSNQGHPCRATDGKYDFAKVGRAVVQYGRTFGQDEDSDAFDTEAREAHAWAGDCSFEVEQDHPELVLPLTFAAIDACETPHDAAYVAAGLLENAIVNHGPALIEKIELLAATSAKFRFFLSGVWGERRADPEVWARVCKAAGASGRMDADGRTPSDGQSMKVLSGAEALVIMKERVAATAASLGI